MGLAGDAAAAEVADGTAGVEPPTAAAAAAAYRTGNCVGGRDGKPFRSTLDMGCEDVDIGGGGFDGAAQYVSFGASVNPDGHAF